MRFSSKDYQALLKASNQKIDKIRTKESQSLPGHGPAGSVGKFGNQITAAHGKLYHSKGEAERASQLKYMEMAGDILHLEEQTPFSLSIYCPIKDDLIHICTYIPDFSYYPKACWNGNKDTSIRILEDFKGYATDVYKIKRKLLETIIPSQYPNCIFVESGRKQLQCFSFQRFLQNPIANKNKK
jgi:hypothetical protein